MFMILKTGFPLCEYILNELRQYVLCKMPKILMTNIRVLQYFYVGFFTYGIIMFVILYLLNLADTH